MTKKRPEMLSGKTLKASTNCGSFYLTLNFNEGELFEIRMKLGKSGNCVGTMLETMGIFFSVILQSDIDRKKVIKIFKQHLSEIKCGAGSFYYKGEQFTSCLDFVAKQVLGEYKK